MPCDCPMPADRADAFNKAIAALHNWIVEDKRDKLLEPTIVQRHTIAAVCDFVEVFNEPMPDNVYRFLCWLAAEHSGTAPQDRSYASGARCLRMIRDSHADAMKKEPNSEP